ncbi:hypothetical protein MNB_SM-7-640 [hydrothermal vent metagenome]|uniref:Polysaccharide biosynthesis protein n=1 Tax=hydrothermal vent metagenome TaxID=652676 RepID=A0A1W1BN88_9ZZZZ
MKKLLLSSSVLTIIVMGINFLFKIYLSYKLPKEFIGVFYTFMDIITIGIMLFSGFRDALIVAYDRYEYSKILFWYRRVFFALAFVVLCFEIIYYLFSSFSYPLIFLVGLFLLNSYMVYLSYLNASQKRYRIMLFETLVMAVGLVGGFFLASIFLEDLYALFVAYVISYSSRIIYIQNFSDMQTDRVECSFSYAKDFFKNVTFSSLMYFFSGFFISISGVVLLYFYHDKVLLAEYQVVVKGIFFALVAIFVFPLNTYIFPQISKLIAQESFGEIKRIEKKLILYLFLLFLILLGATFLTQPIISMIYPSDYASSYRMLNLMLPLLPFIAYTTFALNIIKGVDRFDMALIVRLFGSMTFFISFYLLYRLGIDAPKVIVLSLDSAFFVMFLLALFFRWRLFA